MICVFSTGRVSLEDLFNGKTSKLQMRKNVICKKCNGQGGKSGAVVACKTCSGRGIKISIRQLGPGMVQQMQSVCPDCKGEGEEYHGVIAWRRSSVARTTRTSPDHPLICFIFPLAFR